MKILQVSTHINIGGVGNYILQLSRALKMSQVEVLVASSGGSLKGEFSSYGIETIDIDMDTKFEFAPKVISAGFRLGRLAKEKAVDVIHAHSRVSQVAALIASRYSNRPVVTTCHGYFRKRLRGVFDTWGDKVIAISDPVRRHLIEDIGVKESRIAVVHNGIDVQRFSQKIPEGEVERLKNELGLGKGVTIGTVGRLSAVKGQKFLIEAMKDILRRSPDAECIIVGSGEESEPLKTFARSAGVERAVKFFPADADARKYYSVMDIFVFPSLKEGLGLALLEALAAGKPCVASRVGGISDIIEDEAGGLLVNPQSSGAISAGVIRLIDDPDLRRKLALEGRKIAGTRFSVDDMRDKVMAVYNDVISKRTRI